ncbi:hypothetical protein [Shimia sp.]
MDQFRLEGEEAVGAARIDPVDQFRLEGVEAVGAGSIVSSNCIT